PTPLTCIIMLDRGAASSPRRRGVRPIVATAWQTPERQKSRFMSLRILVPIAADPEPPSGSAERTNPPSASVGGRRGRGRSASAPPPAQPGEGNPTPPPSPAPSPDSGNADTTASA